MTDQALEIQFPTITRKLSRLLVNSPKDILITELPQKDFVDEEIKDQVNINNISKSPRNMQSTSSRIMPK